MSILQDKEELAKVQAIFFKHSGNKKQLPNKVPFRYKIENKKILCRTWIAI
jgi:hypothetical protein